MECPSRSRHRKAGLSLGFEREYPADGGSRFVRRHFALEAELDPSLPASATVRGRHKSEVTTGGTRVGATSDVYVEGST